MTFQVTWGVPGGQWVTFVGQLGVPGGQWVTSVGHMGVVTEGQMHCKLVLLAEIWRLLGAATNDSGWPEWSGWLLEGSSEGLLQAGSAGRTLEAVDCS